MLPRGFLGLERGFQSARRIAQSSDRARVPDLGVREQRVRPAHHPISDGESALVVNARGLEVATLDLKAGVTAQDSRERRSVR